MIRKETAVIVTAMVLVLGYLCMPRIISAEEGTEQGSGHLEIIMSQLRKAIQAKDFTSLYTVAPISDGEALYWSGCNSGASKNLSYEVMVEKLVELSKDAQISINSVPERILSKTIVETKGWSGEAPYLYFEFMDDSKNWRFLGVYYCQNRSSDFQHAQAALESKSDQADKKKELTIQFPRTTGLIEKLTLAISKRNFDSLRDYVPSEPSVKWGDCGPGDTPSGDMSVKTLNKLLLSQLGNELIVFNPGPNTYISLKDGSAFIESEGWVSEYPYLGFGFDLERLTKKWILRRVCYSSHPGYDVRPGAKYQPLYVRKPTLPRPGPRVFEDDLALRDRLHESLQFNQPETLKVYAVKPELVLGLCDGDSKTKQLSVRGHKVPANEVVEFIKTGTVKYPVPESPGLLQRLTERTKDILSSSSQQPPRYEGSLDKPLFERKSAGTFPYVLFWANTSKGRWEWSGVSYCKVPHRALLFPDDPRYKQDKNQ